MFRLLRRRPRWYQLATARDRRRNLLRLLLWLTGLFALHVLAMLAVENLPLRDAVWLTLTTLTTVGYGDLSAKTLLGQTATILFLYLIGIFLLAQLAGEYIDYRANRKERMIKGLWNWNMKDHIVIINTPARDGDRYLRILVRQIREAPGLRDLPVQILTSHYPDGLPDDLREHGVVHHHGVPEGPQALATVDAQHARYVLVLAESIDDPRADSVTLDVLVRLQELAVGGYVIAECIQDENRQRFRRLGADAVLRPVRAYPELMARAMAARGTETILEDLFDHHGTHPRRYDMALKTCLWRDLATRLLQADLGTLLGYLDRHGSVITGPYPGDQVEAEAIFLLVHHDRIPSEAAVADALNGLHR